MTRTDIRDAFGRNMPHERVAPALELLARRGLIKAESVKSGGRPSEIWRAAA